MFTDKYIALVVLHHTFDRELIIPDSSRTVTRDKTFIVDCLFSEDEGLFSCHKNGEAIKNVAEWLKFVVCILKYSGFSVCMPFVNVKIVEPKKQQQKLENSLKIFYYDFIKLQCSYFH